MDRFNAEQAETGSFWTWIMTVPLFYYWELSLKNRENGSLLLSLRAENRFLLQFFSKNSLRSSGSVL
jgi:hypothetical protein